MARHSSARRGIWDGSRSRAIRRNIQLPGPEARRWTCNRQTLHRRPGSRVSDPEHNGHASTASAAPPREIVVRIQASFAARGLTSRSQAGESCSCRMYAAFNVSQSSSRFDRDSEGGDDTRQLVVRERYLVYDIFVHSHRLAARWGETGPGMKSSRSARRSATLSIPSARARYGSLQVFTAP